MLWWWWCCNSLLVVVTISMMPLCTTKALLYTACRDRFLPFNYFCLGVGVFLDHSLVCQLPIHRHLCWPCHSLLSDKENCFVCLSTVAFLSVARWVFSLTIPYDMHLVVLTHHFLFWVICHPIRTFSPKEFEREPQNRLSLLPTARPYPGLPLTHDPQLLYWLGTSW